MAGRRIDDHESWIGIGSNGTVFPMGSKLKSESSADGAGSLGKYEDTTEAIKSQQLASKAKVAAYPHKPGTRN